jgi:hypothetical protein
MAAARGCFADALRVLLLRYRLAATTSGSSCGAKEEPKQSNDAVSEEGCRVSIYSSRDRAAGLLLFVTVDYYGAESNARAVVRRNVVVVKRPWPCAPCSEGAEGSAVRRLHRREKYHDKKAIARDLRISHLFACAATCHFYLLSAATTKQTSQDLQAHPN